MRSLVHVCPLALSLIAGCGTPPPSAEPDGGVVGAPLAHVEVHTPDDELRFFAPDGALAATARAVGGVASADVPAGSSVVSIGAVTDVLTGDGPRTLRGFESATALADGDVITLGAAAQADRPAVIATLPAPPAGTTDVRVTWCGRDAIATGPTIELARGGCGDRNGALIVAGDGAPRAAILVDDLGAGGAIDLSARAWQPITPIAVTLAPAAATWSARGGAILDGEVVPLGDAPVSATGATAMVPTFAGGAVIATITRRTPTAPIATTDEVAVTRADASAFTLDVSASPFPALSPIATPPRSFAIDGDVDAARAALVVIARLDDAAELDTWLVHLRGADRAFTLPGGGAPALASLELVLRSASAGRVWTRRLELATR